MWALLRRDGDTETVVCVIGARWSPPFDNLSAVARDFWERAEWLEAHNTARALLKAPRATLPAGYRLERVP